MITTSLIDLIKSNSGKIASKWSRAIITSNFTKTYRKFPEQELIKLGVSVYINLVKWLEKEIVIKVVEDIYVKIGKKRYLEGFPLCEVLYSLNMVKRELWNFVQAEGFISGSLQVYQAMDLLIMIYRFFDSASFYLTRGYHEALYLKIKATKGIDNEIIMDLLPPVSFDVTLKRDQGAFEKMMEGFNLFKVK